MSGLHVSLFGKFCLHCNGHMVEELETGKVQELLCYLLLHRKRPHPREALACLLWQDYSTAQSKKYLRKLLWQLQTILEPLTEIGKAPLLLVKPEWVEVNVAANLWLDIAVFEQAYTHIRSISTQALSPETAVLLQQAVQLYRGELLEGWYQDWCLLERERFHHMLFISLDKLMHYCATNQDYETGVGYGMWILQSDRAREHTHRALMRLYYLAGDRTEALRQYERCVVALTEELGVEPTQRTHALYQQIRADQLEPIIAPFVAHTLSTSSPLSEVLAHLKQIQTILSEAQKQVEQEIEGLNSIWQH